MDYTICGALIPTEEGYTTVDVQVEGGRISAIGSNLSGAGVQVDAHNIGTKNSRHFKPASANFLRNSWKPTALRETWSIAAVPMGALPSFPKAGPPPTMDLDKIGQPSNSTY